MKLDPPANPNYAATVVRLPALTPLEGCDNLVGASLYGFQAIVDKTHQAGELGIAFTAECQLSLDFAAHNNLHRHADLNVNPDEKGYLEDNRRVRAIKLRGHRSDCLFMPIQALSYLGIDVSSLKEGDTFDHLDGKEICRKYVIRTPGGNKGPRSAAVEKFVRVDKKLFPEHIDTDNYFRNKHLIGPDEIVYVTQKVHGTSIRVGTVTVARKLNLRDRIAKRFGVRVTETEYDHVYGSRKVIKDANNPLQNHYYGHDLWTQQGQKIEHLIPEDFIVYAELIGWTEDGAAIQADYTYEYPAKTCGIWVYRVAHVNPRGVVTDLSWPQVKEFCGKTGLNHVPELWSGYHRDFTPEAWLDVRYAETYENALPLGPNRKLVDEGVCVRADGLTPRILKAKSPVFLGHETAMLDKGTVDLESSESDDVDAPEAA